MRLHRLCPVAVVALMLLPAIAAAKPARDVDVQLRDGTDRLGGAVDTDALEAYWRRRSRARRTARRRSTGST
jgi:hypothetical protein